MTGIYNDWAWKPDNTTVVSLRNGNRKLRIAHPEVPPHQREEYIRQEKLKMATEAAKKSPKKLVRKVSKKTDRAAGPAVDKDSVPLKALCQEMKLDPRAARRVLRKAKISGHDSRDRWTFKKGSSALDKAREALSA